MDRSAECKDLLKLFKKINILEEYEYIIHVTTNTILLMYDTAISTKSHAVKTKKDYAEMFCSTLILLNLLHFQIKDTATKYIYAF
jgi:hypothetical protein